MHTEDRMNYQVHNQTINLGNGREITIETGKLAKQAHGSVVVKSGNTMLLAAAFAASINYSVIA
jgi:polyribonucleotide nucleotidyltransferase